MITEIVKVDAKGRITIPAYIRLLLNVDEGGKVLMSIDEEKGIIVLRAFQDQWMRCTGILSRNDLLTLMTNTKIVSIKCASDIDNIDMYKCDIVVAGDVRTHKLFEKLSCYRD